MKLTFSLYPTPIYRLHQCEKEISSKAQIWIKREDQCGEQYGGNKVRKLEYILNEAQKKGAKTVFSIGALGSNHVLATSIYAHKIKLHNVAFLVPQPYQDYVKKNILGSLALDTDLIYLSPTRMIFVPFIFLYYYFKYWIKDKAKPYLIWFGGSSKLGSLGSFDMAQELVSQIKNNEMPKPDMIFVPVGTCGTMSGVVLAMKMFDPSIKVCGVSVFNSLGANTKTVATLVNGMITLLKLKTSKIKSSDVYLKTDFLGPGYAHFTNEGIWAMDLIERCESISLEGTYTGKALAAVFLEAQKNESKDKVILFINTYNSKDLSDLISLGETKLIPKVIRALLKDSSPQNVPSGKL